MKLFFLIVICLSVKSIGTSAQILTGDSQVLTPDSIAKKYHVKTTTERRSYNKSVTYSTETYDSSGKIIEFKSLDSAGMVILQEFYHYNSASQLFTEHRIYFNRKDTFSLNDTLFYNKHGALLGSPKVKKKYNSAGRLIERRTHTYTDWDMKPHPYKTEYNYDSAGRVLTTKNYMDKSLESTIFSKYNEHGQLIMETYSYPKPNKHKNGTTDLFEPNLKAINLKFEITYTYNEKGLILKQIMSGEQDSPTESNYTYTYY